MTFQRNVTIASGTRGLLLFGLFLIAGSVMKGNLVVNGSFETGPFAGSFTNLPGGTTTITGWTVTGEGIDYIGTLWTAADGTHSLDLDGSASSTITPPFDIGGVAQTFATTSGTMYLVTFDLAGNPLGLPLIKSMRVSAAGQQAVFTFNVTGKSTANMGWAADSWTFTATGPSTTLEFRSLDTVTGWGPALDNVSVTAIGAAVPEPSSFLLLGTALAGLVVARRKWRRD
jgi:choice-of-anchor C domain-containing protein